MATQMFKIKKIKEAAKDLNIEELKTLAKKHGFINNKLRKQVWPILLGLKPNNRTKPKPKSASNLPKKHKYSNKSNHNQINKDIPRSALNYYNINETQEESQHNLGRILHSMFDESQEMHYIQGFNDVVSVFYAVCGNHDLAKRLSKKVARTLLRDYIMNGSQELGFNTVQMIFQIISYCDRELHKLFASINAHLLSFCVSWLITWFAHEIRDMNVIARIYDYVLCSHELIPLYMSSALLIYFRKELLMQVHDDVTLHCFFQELKWEKIDFNKVIHLSEELFKKYPPRSYSMSSILSADEECDEIKDEFGAESSDSESGYAFDIYSPSVAPSEGVTPLVDPVEDLAHFNIDESIQKQSATKPKTRTKSKKFDFLEAFHSFEDKLEKTIDDFVAIFDTKHMEKEAASIHHTQI
eukprot:13040_1